MFDMEENKYDFETEDALLQITFNLNEPPQPSLESPDYEGSNSTKTTTSVKQHYFGHRLRLRTKFLERGEAAIAEYEHLELILFRSIPRKDVKELAKVLINSFGSVAEVISADPKRLLEHKGVNERVVADLKCIELAAQKLAKSTLKARPVLSCWKELVDYCRATMAYSNREKFRIIFLNRRNYLIGDEIHTIGTVDQTPAYPREIAKRALELSATAIVLIHNHPSGDPTPSQADIVMTRAIQAALKPLGIVVHDHVIIAREGHASFKGLKLLF